MADPLGAGIGTGLSSFAENYMRAKQMKQENDRNQQYADMAKQNQEAGLLSKGMQVNPDNTVGYTETQQQINDAQKQQALSQQQIAKEEQDPTSERSQRGYTLRKNTLNQLQPGAGDKMIPQGSSEAELKQYDPFIEKMVPGFSANIKAKAMTDVADTKADTALAGAASKGGKDQNNALNQTIQQLESARGNPAAAQAEKDLYSTQKIDSLINKYGDPNKLSNQEVNLLVGEVAKVATGGVPTGHEMDALKPGTAEAEIQSLWSKLSNNPTPANAGKYVDRLKSYADDLSENAKNVIQDKYGRIIESKKDALGDANYKKLQDNYLNRFKEKKGLLPGKSETSASAGAHPQDNAAVAWAKANPKDPRSAQILKANGVQ